MTIGRVNSIGWGFGVKLTSAQATALDVNIAKALDRTAAGDTLAGPIDLQPGGRILQNVVVGPDANTTFLAGAQTVVLITGAITAQRYYTLSASGAQDGDEITFVSIWPNATPVELLGVSLGVGAVFSLPLTIGKTGTTSFVRCIYSASAGAWILWDVGPIRPFSGASSFPLWFPCNETSGSLASGGTVSGAGLGPTGTVAYGAIAPTERGVVVGAGNFVGATGKGLFASACSISCLYNRLTTGFAGNQFIWGRFSSSPAERIVLFSDASHVLSARFVGTFGNVVVSSGVTVTNGAWYHLGATFDGGLGLIYVNGVEMGRAAASGTLTTDPTDTWTLGATGGSHKAIVADARVAAYAQYASEMGSMGATAMRTIIGP